MDDYKMGKSREEMLVHLTTEEAIASLPKSPEPIRPLSPKALAEHDRIVYNINNTPGKLELADDENGLYNKMLRIIELQSEFIAQLMGRK